MSLKNLTNAEYYAHIEDHGHVLKRDPDGSIDEWALDCDTHNGPACARAGCYESWCHHCREPVKRCAAAMPELFPLTADDAKAA